LCGLSVLLAAWAFCPGLARAQVPQPDAFDPAPNGSVCAVVVLPDGMILAGGAFTTMGGQPHNGLARLNPDGTVDTSFGPALNGPVYCLAVQADGKVLVGGAFTTFSGQAQNLIARLNADGTLDGAFNPDPTFAGGVARVMGLAVQADGKILAVGNFEGVPGLISPYLVRLNADGTPDAGFNQKGLGETLMMALQPDGKILVGVGAGVGRLNADGTWDAGFSGPSGDSDVGCLALQADGKILVGGYFTAFGGQTRPCLARLNVDGTLDVQFAPGLSPSYGYYVSSVAVQADGKIVAGGLFSSVGGQPRNCIVRLNADGSLDSGFNVGSDADVQSLTLQANGEILVGGLFASLGGQPRSFFGRLNATTNASQSLGVDGSAITWLRGGSSPEVWRATFDLSTNASQWTSLGEGSRIAGGWELTNVYVPSGSALRARGFLDGGFQDGSACFAEAYFGAPAFISVPAGLTNNAGTTASFNLVVGGSGPLGYQWFKDGSPLADGANIAGAATPSLTLSNVLGRDAGTYSLVVSNVSGTLTSPPVMLAVVDPVILVQPANQDIEPGQGVTLAVTAAGTAPLAYEWFRDGLTLAGATGPSLTLTNVQGSDAGNYWVVATSQYGSTTSSVALLTVNLATLDSSFNPESDGPVFALALQADGKILVGGSFANLSGQPRSSLARLGADGSLDGSFNPGTDGDVLSIVAQIDGSTLVGGGFSHLAGQPRAGIGRLNADGSLDFVFAPVAGAYNYSVGYSVASLAAQADGSILVGGVFGSLSGQGADCLGLVDAYGTPEAALQVGGWGPGNGSFSHIDALAVQADGKILAGGLYVSSWSGATVNGLLRLNPDGSLDTGFSPVVDGPVNALAVQPDGAILAGGSFTTLDGQSCPGMGRLNADGTVDSEFITGVSGSNASVSSLVLQTDGKILVGGSFSALGGQSRANIGRLNADGTVDSLFNPGAGGSNASVYSLALQADGSILVSGSFATLGPAGSARGNLGRLTNTEPATQSLTYDGQTMTWLRGGASPEVSFAAFDVTTNSTDWMPLGHGSRIPGGWQLSGAALPAGSTSIRASGYVPAGQYNGSGWLAQTAASLSQFPWMRIVMNDGRFGFGTNGFSFTLLGAPGLTVVVERSNDLVNWLPFQTNVLTAGEFYFSDPALKGTLRQFYRARPLN
jgi:uncharacterized delta-60 repeat protein